jgi:hypothetical protein
MGVHDYHYPPEDERTKQWVSRFRDKQWVSRFKTVGVQVQGQILRAAGQRAFPESPLQAECALDAVTRTT